MFLVFGVAFVVAPALGTAIYGRWGPVVLWTAVGLFGIPLAIAALLVGRSLRAARVPVGADDKTPH